MERGTGAGWLGWLDLRPKCCLRTRNARVRGLDLWGCGGAISRRGIGMGVTGSGMGSAKGIPTPSPDKGVKEVELW